MCNFSYYFRLDGRCFRYDRLCLCVGARPKLIYNHPHILGLRDLQSVEELITRLSTAKRIAIVGNGGIALELIYQLKDCHIDWIVKEDYIGSAFFDATASEFIMPTLLKRKLDESIQIVSHHSKDSSNESTSAIHSNITYSGYGLGPQWMEKSHFRQKLPQLLPQPLESTLQV